MSYRTVALSPSAPASNYHPELADLIDIDAQHPQWIQHPRVEIEIHNPRTGAVYAHSVMGLESMVRQNSFTQRSQTVDIVLHDAVDWIHPTNDKPFHSLMKLVVMEGYEGVLQQTFSGVLTDVDYTHYPTEIHMTASDALYFADNFYILSPLYYGGIAAEDAVRDLLARCGINSSFVNIGYDGGQSFYVPPLPQTDGTKGRNGAFFSYETMDSALEHLTDMYGYSYWCDVSGFIEFQYVRPFPQSSPVIFPYQATRGGNRYNFEVMGAQDADAHYSTTGLPGNLLKVVSHKYSAHNMRNFVGVSNGTDTPTYVSAAPAVPGFPPPVAPYLSPGGASPGGLPSMDNTAELGYYTVAVLFANDLVIDTDTLGGTVLVKAHPDNPADSSTTTLSSMLANTVLNDLNRETEDLQVVTWGNPFVDVGQTFYCKDHNTHIDGMFFITGFQTKFSAAGNGGYTTQLTATGGPTWTGISPRPRPTHRTRQMNTGTHITHLSHAAGWTPKGAGSPVVAPTPPPQPYALPVELSRLALAYALNYGGILIPGTGTARYLLGADGPTQFDCAGLVFYAFHTGMGKTNGGFSYSNATGIHTYFLAHGATTISVGAAQPGDLLFCDDGSGVMGHVGWLYATSPVPTIFSANNPTDGVSVFTVSSFLDAASVGINTALDMSLVTLTS